MLVPAAAAEVEELMMVALVLVGVVVEVAVLVVLVEEVIGVLEGSFACNNGRIFPYRRSTCGACVSRVCFDITMVVVFWRVSAVGGSVGDLGGPFSMKLPPSARDSAARTMSKTFSGVLFARALTRAWESAFGAATLLNV